jgi:hypothetical protein
MKASTAVPLLFVAVTVVQSIAHPPAKVTGLE